MIVIDEVVGQWIALMPVAIGATMTVRRSSRCGPAVIAAFVMFRLFDISSPAPWAWPTGAATRRG